jgi:hypothetical protein
MTEIEVLEKALNIIAGMSREAFQLLKSHWQIKMCRPKIMIQDFEK